MYTKKLYICIQIRRIVVCYPRTVANLNTGRMMENLKLKENDA